MLRELAKHNFLLRCLPILVTGFFNGLDRFGCGRTLHNPISRAKGGRPSATSRTVDENLGIRRKGLNNPPEAFQLIQRRRLAQSGGVIGRRDELSPSALHRRGAIALSDGPPEAS